MGSVTAEYLDSNKDERRIFVIHIKPLSTTPKFVNKVTSGKPAKEGELAVRGIHQMIIGLNNPTLQLPDKGNCLEVELIINDP